VLLWSAQLPPFYTYADQRTIAVVPPILIAIVLAHFALMFLAGALLHQFRNVIPARWSLVAVSAVIVATASLLPNYPGELRGHWS
jgi:hypothetical protein